MISSTEYRNNPLLHTFILSDEDGNDDCGLCGKQFNDHVDRDPRYFAMLSDEARTREERAPLRTPRNGRPCYDPKVMKILQDIMKMNFQICSMDWKPLPRSKSFKSIWRVLHCDGFEQHKTLQFYGPATFNEVK